MDNGLTHYGILGMKWGVRRTREQLGYRSKGVKARRAAEVGQKRSDKITSLKRARTMAIKGAVATAGIAAGTAAVNTYLKRIGRSGIDSNTLKYAINVGKIALGFIDEDYEFEQYSAYLAEQAKNN